MRGREGTNKSTAEEVGGILKWVSTVTERIGVPGRGVPMSPVKFKKIP